MEKKIYSKIAEIQKEIGKLSKDTKGYNYQYFDINQLLEKLQPLLEKHNLVLLQPIDGKALVTHIIDLETEERITSEIWLPENVKPQDMGSAITYYRRYSLVSLLALQAEDDDAAKVSKKPKKQDGKPINETNDEPF